MIKKLQLLYPSISIEILSLCLENVEQFVLDYCNLETVPANMQTLLIAMVQQDLNKLYSEGFQSENVAGVSVNYLPDYTPAIYSRLKKYKRIRVI